MTPRLRRTLGIALLALAALSVPAPARGASVPLNAPLVAGGDVSGFQLSPDGRYAVYGADQDADGVDELYSVALAAPGVGVKLNVSLLPTEHIVIVQISPDSARVVYGIYFGSGGERLYSVPIGGPASAGVQLNDPRTAPSVTKAIEISPDSQRVLCVGFAGPPNIFALFSVPIGGPASAAVQLSAPLAANRGISSPQISPDSRRAVYGVQRPNSEFFDLYSVAVDGTGAPQLLILGASDFRISSDSRRVVALSYNEYIGGSELGSVPIEGPASAATYINVSLLPGGSTRLFAIDPTDRFVVFSADADGDGGDDLFSVPIDGPPDAVRQISAPITAGRVSNFLISPDGSRVIYRAGRRDNSYIDLYEVPITGPAEASAQVSTPIEGYGSVQPNFTISPNSRWVVYLVRYSDRVVEVYSVSLAEPRRAARKIAGPFVEVPRGNLGPISGDSSRVLVMKPTFDSRAATLLSVPLSGPATRATGVGEVDLEGDFCGVALTPDSSQALYCADERAPGVFELFASAAGRVPNLRLHLPLVAQ